MLALAGVLTCGCAGALGAGAAAAVVGTGLLTYTCYDHVTVTDQRTGTKLCDARVTFRKGKSETAAVSCYQAALSAGRYRMRVERPGFEPFDERVEVTESRRCGQTVQTMYVALDRAGARQSPTITPTSAPVMASPPTTSVPAAVVPQASAPAANPPAQVLPSSPVPPPATTAFPDAP